MINIKYFLIKNTFWKNKKKYFLNFENSIDTILLFFFNIIIK